jgi:integrase
MLEKSFGITFFLKSPSKKKVTYRTIYLRVTVDGISKEISTMMRWELDRWNQKTERASGSKEDARSLNYFLDSIVLSITKLRTELHNSGQFTTAQRIIDHIKGKDVSRVMVLEEFQNHNDEMQQLVDNKEFAIGTYKRYVTARSHVEEFIKHRYQREDIEFRELDYTFVTEYEFYLKTVRKCSNNTTLKYIANFKKIVLRAIAKEIIIKDPFKLFKSKKTKLDKKPLSTHELHVLENKIFSTKRLTAIRDIFIFQCYTGLAYIDVKQLSYKDIKMEIDGSMWIMSKRQKTKSSTNIPLLKNAIEIMKKYKDDPICKEYNLVLPVKSNQKMNEYLKEIAILCEIDGDLNTHRARRTFGSTVTLKNGVPINVVKEMMGHHSVTQTEQYALTTQEMINSEMLKLKQKLDKNDETIPEKGSISQSLTEEDVRILKEFELVRSKILKMT